MKRVRSIFGIFTVFLLIILASFLLLSWQSTANLKASLIQTAQLQTKYAATLLEQKGKEIEIEADGILYGENMQNLYAAIENNDVYEYVQQINKMKSFFQERQGRTVGMSGMTLYWPKSGREISTLRQGYFEDSFWENNKESQWKSANKQEIFYMRRRTVEWRGEDQEVWLVLRMDQDFLYEIKEMAAGMDQGGSILMFGGEINVLSQKSVEQNIAGIIRQSNEKSARCVWETEISDCAFRMKQKWNAAGFLLSDKADDAAGAEYYDDLRHYARGNSDFWNDLHFSVCKKYFDADESAD